MTTSQTKPIQTIVAGRDAPIIPDAVSEAIRPAENQCAPYVSGNFTWYPVTGCLFSCWYCSARDYFSECPAAAPHFFKPVFHPCRLDEPRQTENPARVIVANSGDLFGGWVPDEWIDQVLEVVRDCPRHTFQFLTKNPARYQEFDLPANACYGTTVDEAAALGRLDDLREAVPDDRIRFVSFEPLLEGIPDPDLEGIAWCNIGELEATSRSCAMDPDPVWVDALVRAAKTAGSWFFLSGRVEQIRLEWLIGKARMDALPRQLV